MNKPEHIFKGDFTQQAPLPQASLDAATRILSSARLHRYNVAQGEVSEAALLEQEFSAYVGLKHTLALSSGGQAIQIAMRAFGIGKGDVVLTNAFTLAPVPGAIEAVGAKTRLVEINDDLKMDLGDLASKADGAKAILISHMRGHLSDTKEIMKIAKTHNLIVIEDCAHTMGATWDGKQSGSLSHAACYSTQTYKHINSGEGGFLASNDSEFMARATIMSGSYMNYKAHGSGLYEDDFHADKLNMPNLSARMDNLRAAILRPQLANLDHSIGEWQKRFAAMASVISQTNQIMMNTSDAREIRVPSSIQFRIPEFTQAQCQNFVDALKQSGVVINWFGSDTPVAFTSNHTSWKYIERQELPKTDRILSTLFDMRLPLSFSETDCAYIGEIVLSVLSET